MPTPLASIIEAPNEPKIVNANISARHIINLKDLNSSNLFRERKITTSNAHPVQLRVLNNIRTQRATRFSIKRTAITNIIKTYNNQRMYNEESNQITLVESRNPLSRVRTPKHNRGDKKNFNSTTASKLSALANKPSNMLINPEQSNGNVDFKIFQHKRQQAELKRNQLEDDLKENHPYFDKPLFTIGRESSLRKFCQMIVEAKYIRVRELNDQGKDHYKQFHKILGLVSYLDWLMILVTIQSCIGMMFETPTTRLVDTWQLKIVEYLFIFFMSIEMTLKVSLKYWINPVSLKIKSLWRMFEKTFKSL